MPINLTKNKERMFSFEHLSPDRRTIYILWGLFDALSIYGCVRFYLSDSPTFPPHLSELMGILPYSLYFFGNVIGSWVLHLSLVLSCGAFFCGKQVRLVLI